MAAGIDGLAGDELQIEVLDPEVAEHVDASGIVLGVSETESQVGSGPLSDAAAADEDLRAEITVDYSWACPAAGAAHRCPRTKCAADFMGGDAAAWSPVMDSYPASLLDGPASPAAAAPWRRSWRRPTPRRSGVRRSGLTAASSRPSRRRLP